MSTVWFCCIARSSRLWCYRLFVSTHWFPQLVIQFSDVVGLFVVLVGGGRCLCRGGWRWGWRLCYFRGPMLTIVFVFCCVVLVSAGCNSIFVEFVAATGWSCLPTSGMLFDGFVLRCAGCPCVCCSRQSVCLFIGWVVWPVFIVRPAWTAPSDWQPCLAPLPSAVPVLVGAAAILECCSSNTAIFPSFLWSACSVPFISVAAATMPVFSWVGCWVVVPISIVGWFFVLIAPEYCAILACSAPVVCGSLRFRSTCFWVCPAESGSTGWAVTSQLCCAITVLSTIAVPPIFVCFHFWRCRAHSPTDLAGCEIMLLWPAVVRLFSLFGWFCRWA